MDEKKTINTYQSLQTIAADHSTQLYALHQQVACLAVLQAQIEQILPKELSTHCRVTRWQQGQLTIAVDEAVHIVALRYNSAALRDELRQLPNFARLTQIQFKVIPFSHEKAGTEANPKKQMPIQAKILSSSVKKLLIETISNLDENVANAKLKEALLKLADL